MRIEAYCLVQEYERDRVFHIGSDEWPHPLGRIYASEESTQQGGLRLVPVLYDESTADSTTEAE